MIRRLSAGSFRDGEARRLVVPGVAAIPAPSADGATPDVQAMAAEGYRAGYAEGFEQGREDGLRDADTERRALLAELAERQTVQEHAFDRAREEFAALNQALPAALDDFRGSLADMASELALLGLRHLLQDPEAYRTCLRGICTELAAHAGHAAMHVSPGDLPLFDDGVPGTRLVADPSLARGTCRVDHARGEFEASVAGRLKDIYESLVEALGTEPA